MKKILEYLKPKYGRMALGLIIKFVGTVMDLLIPWSLAYMIDDVAPLGDIPLILLWGGVMGICSITALATNIVANRMATKVAAETTEEIRHDLFSKISYLSCAQIDSFSIPSLVSRLTSDTYNVHRMVGMMQRQGIRAPILLLGGIIVTLTLEPVLTLVLISVLPFVTLVVFFVSRKGVPLYTKVQEMADQMVRSVRESISGIRVIKALSKGGYEKERFASANEGVVENETKAGITMAVTNPMMNLLLNIGLTLVIIVGAYRVNEGLAQPGKIISFMTYFTIILNAMMAITRMFVLYSKGSASANRISEVLNTPEDLALQPANIIKTQDHIRFEHVNFSYHKHKNDLTDISFSLRKGETLGIIGGTGSGKSTVIQLLMRLYDADAGTIRINGQNIGSIPMDELHTMFGIAFQNDVLFAESIEENIDFGRRLRLEQIRDAAVFAQADEFIHSKELGYEHTLTSKGTNLSGGQKQRLIIARALAAKPEILILDDSSSALDYRTDAELRKALHQNFHNTTAIIIAQRVSSILSADHIMMLENGKIIGYGTHEELLETCLPYRQINDHQMGDVSVG